MNDQENKNVERHEDGSIKTSPHGRGFQPGNKIGNRFSSTNQPESQGRPSNVSAYLREYGKLKGLEYEVTITKQNGQKKTVKNKIEGKRSINELIAMQVITKAMQGDYKALKMFLDRTEGKAKATVVMEGGETPIRFEDLSQEERDARILELANKALEESNNGTD